MITFPVSSSATSGIELFRKSQKELRYHSLGRRLDQARPHAGNDAAHLRVRLAISFCLAVFWRQLEIGGTAQPARKTSAVHCKRIGFGRSKLLKLNFAAVFAFQACKSDFQCDVERILAAFDQRFAAINTILDDRWIGEGRE